MCHDRINMYTQLIRFELSTHAILNCTSVSKGTHDKSKELLSTVLRKYEQTCNTYTNQLIRDKGRCQTYTFGGTEFFREISSCINFRILRIENFA